MSGFTILEVMVACSILAIGVLGILAAMALNITHSGGAQDSKIASLAIRNKIESLEAMLASLSTGNINAFLATTPENVAGLLPLNDGTAAQLRVAFLTEREANTFLNSSEGVDLDFDGTTNEAEAPPTTDPLWKAYAVRVTVVFGDRTGLIKDPITNVIQVNDRTVEITTILLDKDG